MRASLTALIALTAGPAAAHPGHIGALAGHDHWIAAGAIGLAVVAGLWGALKGRKTEDAKPDEEPEGDEAEA